jgi:hypothetical protein
MKNRIKPYVLALFTLIAFAVNAGAETFSNVFRFATWLNARSANTADKPYTVELNVRDLRGIEEVLRENENKYINLDLSGSTFTSIGRLAFERCGSLTYIIIPSSVREIGEWAFSGCTSLTRVTFQSDKNVLKYFPLDAFPSDMGELYFFPNGGKGEYTRAIGSNRWQKQ